MTEALRDLLPKKRQELKDKWEDGDILALAKDEQMLRNAAAIGECHGYKFVEELDFEKLQMEIENAAK